MLDKNVFWLIRYEDFEEHFKLFKKNIELDHSKNITRIKLIGLFVTTFEFGLKLMKDYLKSIGYVKRTLNQGIERVVRDKNVWQEVLKDRKIFLTIKDDKQSLEVVKKIKQQYYKEFEYFYNIMKKKAHELEIK